MSEKTVESMVSDIRGLVHPDLVDMAWEFLENKTSRAGQLNFYKSKGAAQFSCLPPRYNDRGFVEKDGAILLEVAPGVGKQKWDWDQKISFAFSVADIAKILGDFDGSLRIFHQHDRMPKTVEFVPGEGKYAGTWNMFVAQGSNKNGNHHRVMVPLDAGEFALLVRLLTAMAPKLIGWVK